MLASLGARSRYDDGGDGEPAGWFTRLVAFIVRLFGFVFVLVGKVILGAALGTDLDSAEAVSSRWPPSTRACCAGHLIIVRRLWSPPLWSFSQER